MWPGEPLAIITPSEQRGSPLEKREDEVAATAAVLARANKREWNKSEARVCRGKMSKAVAVAVLPSSWLGCLQQTLKFWLHSLLAFVALTG